MLNYDALKDYTKRETLMKLRSVLEKRLLVIPRKYLPLVEELLDFSYRNPSSGYALALALAVELALLKS